MSLTKTNYFMKIATIIIRILAGLLLLFASIAYFAQYHPDGSEPSEAMITFSTGLAASVYMFPLVKVLELLCGLAFVSGRYVALANLVLLPISVNIFLVHAFMGPEDIASAVFLLLANLFLIYRYWDHYRSVMAAK